MAESNMADVDTYIPAEAHHQLVRRRKLAKNLLLKVNYKATNKARAYHHH